MDSQWVADSMDRLHQLLEMRKSHHRVEDMRCLDCLAEDSWVLNMMAVELPESLNKLHRSFRRRRHQVVDQDTKKCRYHYNRCTGEFHRGA